MSKLVYHYTSIEAFKSIIENQELWLTNAEYLNDRTELENGIEVLKKLYQYTLEEVKSKKALEFFKQFNEQIFKTISIAKVYIISFSKFGDRKSLWESYTPNLGVSIGFDKKLYTNKLNIHGIFDCIYDDDIKEDTLRTLIRKDIMEKFVSIAKKDKINWNKSWSDIFTETFSILKNTYPNYFKILAFKNIEYAKVMLFAKLSILSMISRFKNNSFFEEEECRFIRILTDENLDRISFKMKNSHLIPIAKTPFEKTYIKKVILSPNASKELDKKSFKLFLDKYGFKNVELKESQIPLRSY